MIAILVASRLHSADSPEAALAGLDTVSEKMMGYQSVGLDYRDCLLDDDDEYIQKELARRRSNGSASAFGLVGWPKLHMNTYGLAKVRWGSPVITKMDKESCRSPWLELMTQREQVLGKQMESY